MKKIIFISMIFVLIIAGGINKVPEINKISEINFNVTNFEINKILPEVIENKNLCYNYVSKFYNATNTGCVNNKCECYYNEIDKNKISKKNKINSNLNNNINNKETKGNYTSNFNKNSINFLETLPDCKEKMDFLNVSPIKYNNFKNIIPLGNLNPSGHTFPTDHLYFYLNRADENKWNAGTVNVPLYIPGDASITEISVTEHLSENPIFKDYDLVFYPCKELSFRFGHITSLSDELLSKFNEEKQCDNEYETGNMKFKKCSNQNLNIKVFSGQKIGTVGGNPNQNAFDVWANDFRTKELKFANPNRWYNNIKHTVCPLNYFTEKEKEKLYSLLGGFDNNKRIIEPICGTIEQDIKGTAQGVWFAEGTEKVYLEDPHLALVLDNINPAVNVFSIGNSIPGIKSGIYSFNPELNKEVNTAFSNVKPGNIYCYEQDNWNFIFILELLDEKTLKIEKQTGSKCIMPFKFISSVLFER